MGIILLLMVGIMVLMGIFYKAQYQAPGTEKLPEINNNDKQLERIREMGRTFYYDWYESVWEYPMVHRLRIDHMVRVLKVNGENKAVLFLLEEYEETFKKLEKTIKEAKGMQSEQKSKLLKEASKLFNFFLVEVEEFEKYEKEIKGKVDQKKVDELVLELEKERERNAAGKIKQAKKRLVVSKI